MKEQYDIISATLLFAFLFTSSVIMHFLWKSLIKSNYTSIGVIENVKTKTSNGSTWHTPTVTYCVDGKTYTNRSCMSKIHSFEKGQKINVRYLKRFPRFSVVCDNTGYLSKPFLFSVCSAIIVYVYVFILIKLTISSEKASDRIIDMLLIITFLVLIVVNFISEWRTVNSQNVCKGKIIFSEERRNQKIVIAEYILGDIVYQTREMLVPSSALSDNPFNVDDEVMVRYSPSKPYHSMIADDTVPFKKAKAGLILAAVFVFGIAFMYFLLN